MLFGRHVSIKTAHPFLQVGRAVCGIGALSINIFVVRHLMLSTAQMLQYTGPLFLGLWALGYYLIKGKKVPWLLLSFLLLGFVGVLFILRPGLESKDTFYILLGLLSGALSSGSSIFLRLLGLKNEPTLRTLFWFAAACVFAGATATWAFSDRAFDLNSLISIPILGMGLFTALGQWAQTTGWKQGKTLLCAALQYSSVAFALVFGFVLFQETPDLMDLIGFAVIIAASCAATYFRNKEKSSSLF